MSEDSSTVVYIRYSGSGDGLGGLMVSGASSVGTIIQATADSSVLNVEVLRDNNPATTNTAVALEAALTGLTILKLPGYGEYLRLSGPSQEISAPQGNPETPLDLSEVSTARLRCTVSVPPGIPGPVFEARIADGPIIELGRVPIDASAACREVEIDLQAVVGWNDVRIRLASGSSVADGTRLDDLSIELDPMHGPCEAGSVAVDEPGIQACTCKVDPYCCETAWDELCITTAMLVCGADCPSIPTCGQDAPCELAHEEPGCREAF